MSFTAIDTASAHSPKMAGAASGVGNSNAEDVSNMIIMIDPTETPLLSSLPRKSATAVTHEWLTESLADAAANKKHEGRVYGTKTISARTRVTNVCQISDKVFEVTGTQQAVTQYGVTDEIARQAVLSMKELKRDINFDLWQSTIEQADTAGPADTTSARATNGYANIQPSAHVGGAELAIADFSGAVAEGYFTTVCGHIYDDGPSPNIAYMLPSTKALVSKWVGRSTKNFDQEDKEIITVIEVHENDYGTVRLVMDRQMTATSQGVAGIFVGNWDNAALAVLRPFEQKMYPDIPKDAIGGVIQVEWCNEYGNVNSYGGVMVST